MEEGPWTKSAVCVGDVIVTWCGHAREGQTQHHRPVTLQVTICGLCWAVGAATNVLGVQSFGHGQPWRCMVQRRRWRSRRRWPYPARQRRRGAVPEGSGAAWAPRRWRGPVGCRAACAAFGVVLGLAAPSLVASRSLWRRGRNVSRIPLYPSCLRPAVRRVACAPSLLRACGIGHGPPPIYS
jgi:hypothetical protein